MGDRRSARARRAGLVGVGVSALVSTGAVGLATAAASTHGPQPSGTGLVSTAPIRLQQRAVLAGSTMDRLRRQGGAVAVSGDGRTVAVAAVPVVPSEGDPGRVYVFVGAGSNWRLQATLRPLEPAVRGVATDWGVSLAMSADGNHIAVGDDDEYPFRTGAHVVETFARVAGSWGSAVAVPIGPDEDQTGSSVALSGDGRRLIVGAPVQNDHPDQEGPGSGGAVFVYAADAAGGWVEEQELEPPVHGEYAWVFGTSIALSADGATVLVGSIYYGTETGVAQVDSYSVPAVGWQHTHTFPPVVDQYRHFEGSALALSGDGRTAVIGTSGTVESSAAVYARTGTGWSRRATFTAHGTSVNAGFGASVAMSADGATVLIGAPERRALHGTVRSSGGAYRFTRDGSVWHWGGDVYPSPPREDQLVGTSVALSADGGTAVLGAPTRGYRNLAASSALVFAT